MTWFRCVDKSGSSAVLGHKSITQNGTYNASSDNLDGYDQVIVNVSGGGGLSWIEYHDDTFTETQSSFTIAVNPNKRLLGAMQFLLDPVTSNRVTGFWCRRKKTDFTSFLWGVSSVNNQNPPVESNGTTNYSFTFDDVNNTITITSTSRYWKSAVTYRTVLIYEET